MIKSPLYLSFAAMLVLGLTGHGTSALADTAQQAGPTKYSDIESMAQLKAVWDFHFTEPTDARLALAPISTFLAAIADNGPASFEPASVVVVSRGAEVQVWANKNYSKYKDIVDRAKRLNEMGVKFEICGATMASLGLKASDFPSWVGIAPTGLYALTYWQQKGYSFISGRTFNPGQVAKK